MTLGGTLIVRNAIQYDYCVEEAILSLVGVCDEVVVVDGYSDDGTETLLARLDEELGIRVLKHPWQPSPLGEWLSELTNYAREQLSTEFHINLQADEVLSEEDYPLIRAAAETGQPHNVQRLNFYFDHKHTLKPEVKVGQRILRLAPKSVKSIGDAQGLGHPHEGIDSLIRLFHYGFIRLPIPLSAKSKMMHMAFFNTYDPLIDAIAKEGLPAMVDPKWATAVPMDQLIPYDGTHPKIAWKWLEQHGFKI